MDTKFAFIGAGALAGAVAECLVSYAGGAEKAGFYLYDKSASKYESFAGKSYVPQPSIESVVKNGTFIVLSVKPQNLPEVLDEIKKVPCHTEKTYILPCAGVPIKSVTDALGDVGVVRVMPNMPLKIGHGVTAMCRNELVTDTRYLYIYGVFASCGDVFELPEGEMNAVIGATASSPAYVYLFIEAMVEGCKRLGMDPELMLGPVCHAVIGSAYMLLNSGMKPDELISMVATKGGTTESAISVLEAGGFVELIADAMTACARRADELADTAAGK
ncbi:MAG: pyrroline-5-carboxylate reductase [Clostridiales bacterium]|nr:pyrroline-5-carboxylate reductase [Clostridiales bacterium]